MRWTRITAIAGFIVLLGIAALASPFAADSIHAALNRPAKPGPISRYPMAFKHLGFGDLNTCVSAQYPMIERTERGRATTFLVKASVPCGLEVRNPSHYAQDGILHLSYEAHFTGSVDMCNCEYRSIFALADLPPRLTKVEFSERYLDSAP